MLSAIVETQSDEQNNLLDVVLVLSSQFGMTAGRQGQCLHQLNKHVVAALLCVSRQGLEQLQGLTPSPSSHPLAPQHPLISQSSDSHKLRLTTATTKGAHR